MTPQEFFRKILCFENYAWRTGFRELRSDEKTKKKEMSY